MGSLKGPLAVAIQHQLDRLEQAAAAYVANVMMVAETLAQATREPLRTESRRMVRRKRSAT